MLCLIVITLFSKWTLSRVSKAIASVHSSSECSLDSALWGACSTNGGEQYTFENLS